jgi:hypothetical protein
MATHAIHHVPGGSPEPILYDDCPRCEEHANGILNLSLDRETTGLLWRRMVQVEHEDMGRYRSEAEATACHTLYGIAVWMERYTRINPWTLETI